VYVTQSLLTMPETALKLPGTILTRKDEIAARFLALLERHVDELITGKVAKRLSASDFGRMLFIHPRHLTTTVKLVTGKSPCDFMEERLVLEAQTFLRQADMPVADISYRLGFSDPSNFTKFYKGMTGHTPREYRKNLAA
jgi:AraC family transcriptional regulator of adaptative response / methylphosphotriester-DNA alkyltransferase methyltransferase